jgi:hypothetical protein
MTLEEALEIVTKTLDRESLSAVQVDIFRKTLNDHSHHKIASELNHKYGYIKGADLWKLLSQSFGLQVTKLSLQDALGQYFQQTQTQSPSVSSQRNCLD